MVDAFRVTELIDNPDPDLAFGALSNYNNTQTTANSVGYVAFGANWNYQTRFGTEYNSDIHWAQANGSEATIHFTGTGIVWEGNSQGIVDFYLDGVFLKQTNMQAFGGKQNQVGCDVSGLTLGNHQPRFVKTGGTYVEFDNFRVYNSVNDQWTTSASGGALNGTITATPLNGRFPPMTFDGQSAGILARETAAAARAPRQSTARPSPRANTTVCRSRSHRCFPRSPRHCSCRAGQPAPHEETRRAVECGTRCAFTNSGRPPCCTGRETVAPICNNPANWLENEWEQWNVYVFDANTVSGAAALNSGFGSGDLHLLA